MATRIEALVHDPDGARRMGEAGRRRVLEHFDMERYLDDLLDAYRVASMAK
jgi:glycosyltransferase involved in cell wall biosynthesis